jgi:hypothetical protein
MACARPLEQGFQSAAGEEKRQVKSNFEGSQAMSEDEKKVNVKSVEFKQGVEAGLNSEEDTKNWKAGNELGRELKEEGEDKDAGQ